MTEDRRRLILSCVHWDQFIFLIAEDDPMRCPRMDHYGFAVGSLDELRGIQERAEAFRKSDDRMELIDLHVDDQEVVKIHSLYVRYLLPMTIEFQYWEFPEPAGQLGRLSRSAAHPARRYRAGMTTSDVPGKHGPSGSAPCTSRAPRCSCPTPGTSGRPPCSPRSGSRRIATTSGGFAATRGRLDGAMTKDEVLAHAGELAEAVDVPVSADLENCFAARPRRRGRHDHGRHRASGWPAARWRTSPATGTTPIYELAHAAERVRAAAEAAHGGPVPFVLTARAENYLHGRPDLADTIARLQAYQEAGADVLFAPRVVDPAELRQLLAAVDLPVSVLVAPGRARRSASWPSSGSAGSRWAAPIAVAAYGAAINAVTELRDEGTYGYWDLAARGPARDRRRLQSLTRDRHLDLDRPVARAARPRRWPSGCGGPPRRRRRPGPCSPRPRRPAAVEVGRRGHEAGHREHPLDPVERAQRLLQDGQGVQRAHGGGLAALLHRHGVAQAPEAGQFPGDAGQLPRGARHAVVHHDRIERVVRRVRPVQREAQLGQPGADVAFAHRPYRM